MLIYQTHQGLKSFKKNSAKEKKHPGNHTDRPASARLLLPQAELLWMSILAVVPSFNAACRKLVGDEQQGDKRVPHKEQSRERFDKAAEGNGS